MKYVESDGINTHSVGYEYDTINNLTKLVETINGITHETSYTYDLDNRVTTVTTDGINKGYTYDAYGRVTTQTVGNESGTVLTETFGYNSGNQITSVTVDTAGQDVAYTYTYDNNGNILSVSDGTNTTSYVYDSANQLLRENNQAANKTWVWTYDNAGNILSKAEYEYTTESLEGVTPTDTVSYTYGNSNWRDLLTSYDGVDIDYDEIGNPIDDGTWEYAWQHGRELERMSDGTTAWTFTYDANGMRTSRTDGTTTYKYVYNGGSLVQMTVGSNTLYFTSDTVTYNGVTYYYVKNLQGDVTAIVDGSGATVATYVYDAWGNLISDEPAENTVGHLNPIRYRGYVYDPESELYYLQSRYYDPEVGRFLNADSFASTGQGILGNNMFAYCGNNPCVYSDPCGSSRVFVGTKELQPVFYEGGSGSVAGGTAITIGIGFYLREWLDDLEDRITKKLALSLSKATVKSYKSDYESHHIAARKARNAEPAALILIEVLPNGVEDPENLVAVHTDVHRRIHTNLYYFLVNQMIIVAYESAGGNKVLQQTNVRETLAYIRAFIETLNALSNL